MKNIISEAFEVKTDLKPSAHKLSPLLLKLTLGKQLKKCKW